MRNLVKYPITMGEIEQCLRDVSDELAKEERVGDMRPLLLQTAAQIIRRTGFATYDIGLGL